MSLWLLATSEYAAADQTLPAWMRKQPDCDMDKVARVLGWMGGPISSALGRAHGEGVLKHEEVVILVPSNAAYDDLSKQPKWVDAKLLAWWEAGLGAAHVITGVNASKSLNAKSGPYSTMGGSLITPSKDDSSRLWLSAGEDGPWPVAPEGAPEAASGTGTKIDDDSWGEVCGMQYAQVDALLAPGGLWDSNPCEGQPGPSELPRGAATALSDSEDETQEAPSVCAPAPGNANWQTAVPLSVAAIKQGAHTPAVEGFEKALDSLLCMHNPTSVQFQIEDVAFNGSSFNGCSRDYIQDGSPCNLQGSMLWPNSTLCMYILVPVHSADEAVSHSLDITLVKAPVAPSVLLLDSIEYESNYDSNSSYAEGNEEEEEGGGSDVIIQFQGINLEFPGTGSLAETYPEYGADQEAFMTLGTFKCEPKCTLAGLLQAPASATNKSCTSFWASSDAPAWASDASLLDGADLISPAALTYDQADRANWTHVCSAPKGDDDEGGAGMMSCMEGADVACGGRKGGPSSMNLYGEEPGLATYWMGTLHDAMTRMPVLAFSWGLCTPPHALSDKAWPSCGLATAFA